jgi:hypothetical protein
MVTSIEIALEKNCLLRVLIFSFKYSDERIKQKSIKKLGCQFPTMKKIHTNKINKLSLESRLHRKEE